MKLDVTDHTFKRLQELAEPLIDTVEDVMVRLLDFYGARKEADLPQSALLAAQMMPKIAASHASHASAAKPRAREMLSGFRKELWELVIQKLPPIFSLHDVYGHMNPLVALRPHVKEMEAAVRNAMQRLRDMGYVEFLDRGEYQRID